MTDSQRPLQSRTTQKNQRVRRTATRRSAPTATSWDAGVFAELIATQIALSRPSSGMVMSLTGAWGSGKSSVLRMVTESLEAREDSARRIVVNYNPWFFSGTDQLISGFLLTLADQLPKSLGEKAATDVADRLRRYGAAVGTLRSLPALGGLFGVVSDVAKEGAARLRPKDVDLLAQRDELAEALEKLGVHLVVVVDDVDRLQSASEIRQVMQMVKLVGDLPGVTYLLAFDSGPVQEALSSRGINGHEYLEKIVQVEHVIPVVSEDRLYGMLDRELNRAFEHLPQNRIDPSRWPAVYEKIVRAARQDTSPRSPFGQLADARDRVGRRRHRFDRPGRPDVPGKAFMIFAGRGKEESAARLKQAAADSGNEEVAQATYNLLFPHTGHVLGSGTHSSGTESDWKRLRRVADLESLYRYLTALTPEDGLSAVDTQRILDSTLDDDAFAAELSERDCQQLVVIASRLAVHAADVAVDRIPAIVRQLNRRARGECGGVMAPLWSSADRIEGSMATLLEQVPIDQRHGQLKAWFDEEADLTNKLAAFEIGRWTDRQQRQLASNDLLVVMLGEMLADLEAMPPAEARELPDIGTAPGRPG